MKLVIGNRNYSSWSLRPWILMRHAGLDVEQVRIPLATEEGERMKAEWCPAGKVPVLHDGPLVLWDSLAICEYVADKTDGPALWPQDVRLRAEARAMSAEMHSGFSALRRAMPMNCRRVVRGFEPGFDTRVDIDRLVDLFETALSRRSSSGGPWLFGDYSVADAMFAPIASRLSHLRHLDATGHPRLDRRHARRPAHARVVRGGGGRARGDRALRSARRQSRRWRSGERSCRR